MDKLPNQVFVPVRGAQEALHYVTLSDIEPEDVRWLWKHRIPLGTVVVCAGGVSLGKTLVSCGISAAVTNPSVTLPDGAQPINGDVILLTAEDNLANTIVPRLIAAGADMRRIHAIKSVRTFDPDSGQESGMRMPDLHRDLELIEQLVDRFRDTVLVWIDPITAYYGSKIDSHNTSDLRGLLHPIQDMAERRQVAVLAQSHFNKNQGQNAVDRVTGSGALVQAARASYVFVRDPETEKRVLVLWSKSNLGPRPDGLAFTIGTVPVVGLESVQPVVLWEDGPVRMDADDALAIPDPRRAERDEAIEFLREELAAGPVLYTDIAEQAKLAGIAIPTLKRAKGELRIQSKKLGLGGNWEWNLPRPEGDHPDPCPNNVIPFEEDQISFEEDHLSGRGPEVIPFEESDCKQCRNWTGGNRCRAKHVTSPLGAPVPGICPDFTPTHGARDRAD